MAEPMKLQYTGGIPKRTREWMVRRATGFQIATSSKRGKPPDGVTYGRGRKEGA